LLQARRGRPLLRERPIRARRLAAHQHQRGRPLLHAFGHVRHLPDHRSHPAAPRRVRRPPGAELRALARQRAGRDALGGRHPRARERALRRRRIMDMDAREARNREAMARLSAGFAQHDVDAILDCFAEDGIFDITEGPDPWGERYQGKTAIRGALTTLFKTLPDVQFVDSTSWVAEDRGTAEWTCVATTPRGRSLRVRGCDLFEFRDGLITRKDSYFKKIVRRDA